MYLLPPTSGLTHHRILDSEIQSKTVLLNMGHAVMEDGTDL